MHRILSKSNVQGMCFSCIKHILFLSSYKDYPTKKNLLTATEALPISKLKNVALQLETL